MSKFLSQVIEKFKAFFPCINKSFQALFVALVLITPQLSYSLPQGGSLAGGNASISHSGTTMHINQTSNKAIINWRSYNVGHAEHVRYQQPSRSSIALNRIDPTSGVSKIYGSITANGQVWLVNPAGIWFGPTAYVNVAGLIATTASINDDDFLAGRYSFTQSPDWHGSIINEGTIKIAEAGLVALVGQGVVNNGLIEANLGTVVLATGNAFTVNFSGNDLISFQVSGDVIAPAVDHDGRRLSDGVTNAGTIVANGGKILMSSRSASEILDHTINMKGIAQANSVRLQNGEIILDGGNGKVKVSGQLLASGKNNDEKGGTVKVTGKVVMLTDNALIDVSGDKGGGAALVGGNAHGVGPEQNAEYALLDTNASINADALTSGHGGKVVLWSDKGTAFYGNIFARGGALGGNGGWVETSGKDYLEATGMVRANAPAGQPGNWLLDPANVTISLAATLNGLFSGGVLNTFTTIANSAIANADTIMASLDSGTSVTILTTPGGTQAGNITVSTPITKCSVLISCVPAGTPTLSLIASSIDGGIITINNAISSAAGILNVVLDASAVTINASIDTNGGDFTSTALNGTTLTSSINTGAGLVSISANQDGTAGQDFLMNAGSSITTTNTSANAISINVNTASGGTGSATLRNITTGNGGTVTVRTDTGGNVTGGDILTIAGNMIDVGNGSVVLKTPNIAGVNIGTAATPIQIIVGSLNATSGAAGIFITNNGTSSLNIDSIESGGAFTLNSTASTGLTDTGPITVTGTTTLVAGAVQDITFDSNSNDFATLTITSGKNVNVHDANSIIMGASTISGTFDLITSGAITQSGALSVTGTTNLSAGSTNNITLSNTSNDFSTVKVNDGNDVTLRDANGLDLGASTISGTLGLTTAGNVTQSGALLVLGTTTVTAGAANDITFNDASNDFSTFRVTTGNNVQVQDTNALILGASTVSGTFDVTSNGNLTQSGTLSVTGLATLVAGILHDITLATAANNFSTVSINNTNNATLRDTNAIILGAATLASSFNVIAEGAITQSGVLTVPTLIAKTLLNAGGAITLNNTANEVSSVDLRARTGGDGANAPGAITYTDATGFDVAAANTTSTVTLTAGDVMTQSGSMAGTTLTAKTLNNAGSAIAFNNAANTFTTIDLKSRNAADTATAAGAISYSDANAIAIGGIETNSTLSLTAGTSVTQTGTLSVGGLATFIASLANTDMSLASAANNFGAAVVFTTTGLGALRDIAFRNISVSASAPTLPASLRNLTFIFDNVGILLPTITLSGTLSSTTSGAVTQSGPLVVTGTSTITAGSANDITLNNAGNNFSTLAVVSGNNVLVNDLNALILGASTISGLLDVTTNGALTDSGNLIVSGLMTLAAGLTNDITLNSAGNNFSTVTVNSADDITLVDANALDLGGIISNDDLTVTAAGDITQSGVLTPGGTATFAAGAANDIVLTNAFNDFTTVGITSAKNVSLVDLNALNLAASTVSGDMTVSAGGAMTDSGNIIVSGSNGLVVSANGGIVLNNGGNQIGKINLTNTGSGNININSDVSLTIAGFNQTSTGTTTFTNTGTLSVLDGVTVNSNNAALAITATDLDLASTGELNSGSANTTITQNTVGGSIGLGDTAGTMTISGSELQRIAADNLTLIAANDGQIIVDNISAANSNNIVDTMTLRANSGTLGNILFQTAPSQFKALTANADNGITVGLGASITTTSGNLVLNGDVGGGVGGNDALTLQANLNAAGSMTLSATNGGINLESPIALTADGITINSKLNGANNLTIDSGSGNTNFQSTVGATTPIGSGSGAAITINSTGTTNFSNTVAANSGISASSRVNFDDSVTLANGNTGSTFNGLVMLSNASGFTFSGFDGLNFNAGLTTANGPMVINSNNSNLNISNLTLGNSANLISGNQSTHITGNISGANSTLTLQNNSPSATGTVTIDGDITLAGLVTFAQPYHVILNGGSNTFSNPVTFNNSNVTLNTIGNSFHFNGGLTSNASVTNLKGTINANGAMTFGANASDQVNLLGATSLITNNDALTVNAAMNGAENLTLNTGLGNILFNANVGNAARLGSVVLQAFNSLTAHGTFNAASLSQNGRGLTNFVNSGLNTTSGASITSNRLTGNIHVANLTINLRTGNFFGSVAGKTGVAAIKQFHILNNVGPGRIFFDGIDIYSVSNAPNAPASIVLPTNYTRANESLDGLIVTTDDWLLYNRINWIDYTGKKISNERVLMSAHPYIEMVGEWN